MIGRGHGGSPARLGGMTAAMRVVVTRGTAIESVHDVHLAVVDNRGKVIEVFGDRDWVFPVRSTVKIIQALPLVESGAAEVFGVRDDELAMACGSHNGEPGHVQRALAWLDRIGLREDDLQCGATVSFDQTEARRYLRAGGDPRRAIHNCSGKHCGFLTLSLHLGADPQAYLDPTGTVQTAVRKALSEACGRHLDVADFGRDGCGAPAALLNLVELGRAFSTLLADRSPVGIRLVRAVCANPWYLAGTGRSDTRMTEALAGTGFTKIGADGVHIAVVPAVDRVIVAKAASGNGLAAQVALASMLRESGLLDSADIDDLVNPTIVDDAGRPVGRIVLEGTERR
jgi:L-asparaginase II